MRHFPISNANFGFKNMRRFIADFVYALLAVILSSVVAEAQRWEMDGFLPEMVDGWGKCDSAFHFNRETLFDYVNGGAEAYLAYDFESLEVWGYCRDTNQIIVETYLTRTSEDAFGLYSQNPLRENARLAQRSSYDSGELRFWKGRYFIRIFNWEAKDKLKNQILQIGKNIARRIKEKGRLPAIFCALPRQGLIPDSEQYFHKQVSLSNVCFISTENLLDLSDNTNGVIADYKIGNDSLKYLLIQYPGQVKAENALESYRNLVGGENGFLVNRYLGIILQGKNLESALYLSKLCQDKLEQAFKKRKLTLVGSGIEID